MIESARILKKQIMECFSKAIFVSVAIDEGSIFSQKTEDINIENPLLEFKPFPAQTITIDDQTAEGYTKVIYDALASINLYKIKIASVICDGNRAQKRRSPMNGDYHYVSKMIFLNASYTFLVYVIASTTPTNITHHTTKP